MARLRLPPFASYDMERGGGVIPNFFFVLEDIFRVFSVDFGLLVHICLFYFIFLIVGVVWFHSVS